MNTFSLRSKVGMIELTTEPTADRNVRMVLADGRVGYVPERYQVYTSDQRTPASVLMPFWLSAHVVSSSVVDRNGAVAEALPEMDRTAIIAERPKQVARHMQLPPVQVSKKRGEICSTADLAETAFMDDYAGAGEGVAYVDADCRLRAFHYGRTVPEGWQVPAGLEAYNVAMSSTQLCFF